MFKTIETLTLELMRENRGSTFVLCYINLLWSLNLDPPPHPLDAANLCHSATRLSNSFVKLVTHSIYQTLWAKNQTHKTS